MALSEEQFTNRWKTGKQGERQVANFLTDNGIKADVGFDDDELDRTRTADWYRVNDVDVICDSGVFVEVKVRSLSFTEDPDSFPFDDIIVDCKDKYYAKVHRPAAYVFISKKTDQMLWIDCGTEDEWESRWFPDHQAKNGETKLIAKKSLLRPASELPAFINEQIRTRLTEAEPFKVDSSLVTKN